MRELEKIKRERAEQRAREVSNALHRFELMMLKRCAGSRRCGKGGRATRVRYCPGQPSPQPQRLQYQATVGRRCRLQKSGTWNRRQEAERIRQRSPTVGLSQTLHESIRAMSCSRNVFKPQLRYIWTCQGSRKRHLQHWHLVVCRRPMDV
jgi:hypothetical protein